MDKFQQDIQRMVMDIEYLIARKLPVAAGKIAKQHIQDNFKRVGSLMEASIPGLRQSVSSPELLFLWVVNHLGVMNDSIGFQIALW